MTTRRALLLCSTALMTAAVATLAFAVARVNGISMAPTLQDHDRLLVNKLAYRMSDPHRGDIVVLLHPLDPNRSFVERVIAQGGDTVQIVGGRVTVNGTALEDAYVPAEFRSGETWGPQVVPSGYFFVMGDHRNNSSDSRHWGYVPKKYIVAKVQLRWWPVPALRVF